MEEAPSEPVRDGALYKFFEISLGFAVTMAVVACYIYILVYTLEYTILHEPYPYREWIILIGAVCGAIAIIISSSIREIGSELSMIQPNTTIYMSIPMGGEEYYGYPEKEDKDEGGCICSDKEKRKEKEISYDFNYV